MPEDVLSALLVMKHGDGSIDHYNYSRIINSPSTDPEVRPGDTIEVRRKFAW